MSRLHIFQFSLIMYYIVPNAFIGTFGRTIYYLNRGIFNMFLILMGIGVIYLNKKIYLRELILILIISIRMIYFHDLESVFLLGLIYIDRYQINKINFSEKQMNYFLYTSIIFTLVYSVYFYSFHGRFISTSIGEKNISGFAIIILYLLCENSKKTKKLKIIFFLLGLLTFSRNFLLAFLIYVSFKKSNLLKKIILRLKLNRFFNISIFSLIFLLLVHIFFELGVGAYGVQTYKTGVSRYTSILDNSNLYRFQANTNVLKYYYNYPSEIFKGSTIKKFKVELRDNKEKYNVKREMEPHNFFYKFLLKYGLFSFYLFWYIDKILGVVKLKKIDIYLVFWIYSIILGVGFYDFYLLILKYLLNHSGLGEKNNEI